MNAITQITDSPVLDRVADPLSQAVRGAYRLGGSAGEELKNATHGVWLGHPLHPVFTDVPIGAWTTALALDTAADGDAGMERAATFAIGVGLAGALGAAVTGLTDWSETRGASRRMGLVHGLLNLAATALMAAAFVQRRRRAPIGGGGGRACAWTGYAVAAGSAYLGGTLVYDNRVGVTHAVEDPPDGFVAVADSESLGENAMTCVHAGDAHVLLVRQHGRLHALAHSCAHLGGPLSEGTLKDGSVVCPWHGSEFRLEDGAVIDGPSTHDQPRFDVREREGQIEVKAARGD
ncbi:MAG TPA: Rieske 2Fe-2S domain-containing protein [Vicinamibacterales bacterium]|jgi:nitrite reductase/ring-hydroxylating ferredoxin subunit